MSLENKVRIEMKRMETAIILPDIHTPYHDDRAISVVVKYIKATKPDQIIQLGDMYDCYSLSRFDKDPARISSLQEEIDRGALIWQQLKEASPKSKLVMLEGNHERRLVKYLMKHPELHGLKALNPEVLFGLKELGIKFVRSEDTYYINNSLVATHGATDDGCKLSQHAGYSAKNTLDKWGNVSGIMGHGHRIGMSTRTLADGTMVQWIESGTLSRLKPEYVKNPNWQHGFVVVKYTKNRFHATPVVIANYEFIADGKVYR
jgi:predicted phosphodiesterase